MEKKYRVMINFKSEENLIKMIWFIKPRKKGEFLVKAVKEFLKNADEEELKDFINPIYEKDFYKLLRKFKNETNKTENTLEKKELKIEKKEVNKDNNNSSSDFESEEF